MTTFVLEYPLFPSVRTTWKCVDGEWVIGERKRTETREQQSLYEWEEWKRQCRTKVAGAFYLHNLLMITTSVSTERNTLDYYLVLFKAVVELALV